MKRCDCSGSDPLMIKYHDEEWGKPVHNDSVLFEFLILEGFQAGLSWSTILNKRENFRKAFDNFDYKKIAQYDEDKVQELLQNAGIVRNKLKVRATIQNAQSFLQVQKEFGSFDKYIWSFTDNKVLQNNHKSMQSLLAKTELSDKISKDLLKRGFKFVGSTIVYSFLQAVGIINDHLVDCEFK
jgi:DNA-3-methyladenine glycosylase I